MLMDECSANHMCERRGEEFPNLRSRAVFVRHRLDSLYIGANCKCRIATR
jgi:hypothetical protein